MVILLGPMGSNLQRVLGLMTPESVNAIVEHARNRNGQDISATNTSIDADKDDQYQYKKDENNSAKDEGTNENLANAQDESENKVLEFQKMIAKDNPKKIKELTLNGIEHNIVQFDKTKVNEINKKAKQKSAIESYQSNIVPNYLKGTTRNDLQGLLINKKCG